MTLIQLWRSHKTNQFHNQTISHSHNHNQIKIYNKKENVYNLKLEINNNIVYVQISDV